jgi:hypothetical protein
MCAGSSVYPARRVTRSTVGTGSTASILRPFAFFDYSDMLDKRPLPLRLALGARRRAARCHAIVLSNDELRALCGYGSTHSRSEIGALLYGGSYDRRRNVGSRRTTLLGRRNSLRRASGVAIPYLSPADAARLPAVRRFPCCSDPPSGNGCCRGRRWSEGGSCARARHWN